LNGFERSGGSVADGGLITVAEAARRLGLSRGTVYVMIQRGQLTRVTAGYRDLIPAWQVEKLVLPMAVAAGVIEGLASAGAIPVTRRGGRRPGRGQLR
jgi:excisionase family DNA binding protein